MDSLYEVSITCDCIDLQSSEVGLYNNDFIRGLEIILPTFLYYQNYREKSPKVYNNLSFKWVLSVNLLSFTSIKFKVMGQSKK